MTAPNPIDIRRRSPGRAAAIMGGAFLEEASPTPAPATPAQADASPSESIQEVQAVVAPLDADAPTSEMMSAITSGIIPQNEIRKAQTAAKNWKAPEELTAREAGMLREIAWRARVLNKMTTIIVWETGSILLHAQETLTERCGGSSHGHWERFLTESCEIPLSTARNYINTAKAFERGRDIAHLSPRVVYKLAAPSVSKELRQEAIKAKSDEEAIEILSGARKHDDSQAEPKEGAIESDDQLRRKTAAKLARVLGAFAGAALEEPMPQLIEQLLEHARRCAAPAEAAEGGA
jgi:hypothetical protein